MNLDSILSALKSSVEADGFRTSCLTEIRATEFTDPNKLEQLVQKWSNAQGWIARQSGVEVLSNPTSQQSDLGYIISAELAKPDCSIQIRRLPTKWIVTHLQEGGSTPYLIDEITQLTVDFGAAIYRRYWNVPTNGAAFVHAWRLIGFEEANQ